MKEFNVTGEVMICENRCFRPLDFLDLISWCTFFLQVNLEGLFAVPDDCLEPDELRMEGGRIHCLHWRHLQCTHGPSKVP